MTIVFLITESLFLKGQNRISLSGPCIKDVQGLVEEGLGVNVKQTWLPLIHGGGTLQSLTWQVEVENGSKIADGPFTDPAGLAV